MNTNDKTVQIPLGALKFLIRFAEDRHDGLTTCGCCNNFVVYDNKDGFFCDDCAPPGSVLRENADHVRVINKVLKEIDA